MFQTPLSRAIQIETAKNIKQLSGKKSATVGQRHVPVLRLWIAGEESRTQSALSL